MSRRVAGGGIQPLAGTVWGTVRIKTAALPLHYQIDRYWMLQTGVGARFTTGATLPEAGFRIIREF